MEIAYLCRLRGIEVITLTEANWSEKGLISNRRKGSRNNITRWNPRLEAAWNAAIEYRDNWWEKKRSAVPMNKASRPLIIATDGCALKKSGFDTSWQRFIRVAMAEGVLTQEERFSLHDLKRRGTTDTEGTRADKQEATGHKSAAMLEVYDKSIPVVEPASE